MYVHGNNSCTKPACLYRIFRIMRLANKILHSPASGPLFIITYHPEVISMVSSFSPIVLKSKYENRQLGAAELFRFLL